MASTLFEDIFDVKDIDPDGKKFERGSVVLDAMNVYVELYEGSVLQFRVCSVRVKVSKWT